MLKLGIAQTIKEFTKAVYLIALGYDNENRKPDIKHSLNDVELLGDCSSLSNRRIRPPHANMVARVWVW